MTSEEPERRRQHARRGRLESVAVVVIWTAALAVAAAMAWMTLTG